MNAPDSFCFYVMINIENISISFVESICVDETEQEKILDTIHRCER